MHIIGREELVGWLRFVSRANQKEARMNDNL
jgi:hypothetical protein